MADQKTTTVEIIKKINVPKKKVISFSLWGDKPKYLIGANYNAVIARQLFVDDGGWICRFYISSDLNPKLVESLKKMDNVEIYKVTDSKINGLFWRFMPPIDDEDVDIFIVRDTDSRLSIREYIAVNEWINSDRGFHIIRDHPHHNNVIMGGMWGMKKINGKFPVDLKYYKKTFDEYCRSENWGSDHTWLWEKIAPKIITNCFIHDEVNADITPHLNMPISYPRFKEDFIGEIFDYDNVPKATDREVMKKFLTKQLAAVVEANKPSEEQKKSTKDVKEEPKIVEIDETESHPLISVIIPTYNRPKDIVNAVESVKLQREKYKNIEIIVVNDGSTEPYPELKGVISIFLHINTREKFKFPCAGYVRNIGAKVASGEYLVFLDDDDIMMPSRILKQFEFIKDKTKFGCSECYIGVGPPTFIGKGKFDINKKVLYNREHYWTTIKEKFPMFEDNLPAEIDCAMTMIHNLIIQSSVMIHRNLFNRVGGYDNLPNGQEDIGLWRKCLKYTNCVYDKTPLTYYQLR